MAKLFPVFSDTASATLELTIAATATAKTVDYKVDSRTVVVNAQGADSAPTYTVNLDPSDSGMLFIVDAGNLNSNTENNAATVVFERGDQSLTVNANTDKAFVMLTESGIVSATTLFNAADNNVTFA
tara:strand:+ start:1576 stop:1956 length:381 start_codon:yes stop_codon:yes gene_type:complete